MILNYYEKGRRTDPVVLFIHGSASDASVWLNELSVVSAKGFYCLSVDLRGHGETRVMSQPKAHMKIDIDSHIQDVRETLDHLDILDKRKVTIVTHSFGGLVAVDLTEQHPEMVDKLILIGLPPKLIFPISTFLKVLLGKPLEIIQKNLDFLQNTSLRPRYKSSIMTNAHVLQEIYKHVKVWNSFKKVPRLRPKVFFAAGRFDVVAPSYLVYRLHLATMNSEFELFKWSGHALMEDEPEKFKRWLLKCIENTMPDNESENKYSKDIAA